MVAQGKSSADNRQRRQKGTDRKHKGRTVAASAGVVCIGYYFVVCKIRCTLVALAAVSALDRIDTHHYRRQCPSLNLFDISCADCCRCIFNIAFYLAIFTRGACSPDHPDRQMSHTEAAHYNTTRQLRHDAYGERD